LSQAITIEKSARVAEATKETILATAFSLFADKGFSGTSMRDIALTVKITPAALYYHFPNKKALHKAALAYAYKGRSTPAVSMLSANTANKSPLETLERFIFRLCERFHDDKEFMRIVQWNLLDAEHDDSIRNILIHEVYQSHFSSLETFLEQIAPEKNCNQLATFIFGMVMQNYFTLPIRRCIKGHKPQEEKPGEVTELIMDLLKNGLVSDIS